MTLDAYGQLRHLRHLLARIEKTSANVRSCSSIEPEHGLADVETRLLHDEGARVDRSGHGDPMSTPSRLAGVAGTRGVQP